MAEVALRHGIVVNEAVQIYNRASQIFTDNRLLLSAPTGHKNQEILVKALDRAYQMSINEPARLKLFAEVFADKHNFKTSSIQFGIKSDQLETFKEFMEFGCKLIDPSHWQIRASSEQAVIDLKNKLGIDRKVRIGSRKNFHGYEVRVVQKKRKRSDKNLATTDQYYASSGVLKYLGCLLIVLIKHDNS